MGPPPGTFERVYAAIKQRLREGIYKPGGRLEPAVLSDELNASVTPIRDALHRLTGERLVDASRQDGFRVPIMTETTLRQLYAWHLDLLLLAVAKRRIPKTGDGQIVGDPTTGTDSLSQGLNQLFQALAAASGNPEHTAALRALSERLGPVQRAEELFLEQTDTETEEIVRAISSCDRKALRRSLVRYHRRREQIVPQLLASLLGM